MFVDRNQMVLRRLSYGIIMFMELQWHKIWGRYMEKLVRQVVGQTSGEANEISMKQGYNSILFSTFCAFSCLRKMLVQTCKKRFYLL